MKVGGGGVGGLRSPICESHRQNCLHALECRGSQDSSKKGVFSVSLMLYKSQAQARKWETLVGAGGSGSVSLESWSPQWPPTKNELGILGVWLV